MKRIIPEGNVNIPPVKPPLPELRGVNNNLCDTCLKSDVCKLKESTLQAVKDIEEIETSTNVFIKTSIKCEKYKYDNTNTYVIR